MAQLDTLPRIAPMDGIAETRLVELARGGHETAIREIVRRNNQRLFRVARSVLHDDSEAEDVVQAAYVKAFTHLVDFRAEARLSTWLTRIALNEAFARLRQRRRTVALDAAEEVGGAEIIEFPFMRRQADPEEDMSRQEIGRLLASAVDGLPPDFRVVFVLRDVEGLSIEETAGHLGIKAGTVKTRLHRARRLLRTAIAAQVTGAFAALYPFDGARCAGMADAVLARLRAEPGAA
jgi:RNA polymerase sigma-70 factor (ECF subfamily)